MSIFSVVWGGAPPHRSHDPTPSVPRSHIAKPPANDLVVEEFARFGVGADRGCYHVRPPVCINVTVLVGLLHPTPCNFVRVWNVVDDVRGSGAEGLGGCLFSVALRTFQYCGRVSKKLSPDWFTKCVKGVWHSAQNR
jgi:hypothetical protein